MNGCFFYVMLTTHYVKYGDDLVQILGYGITTNPKKRSKQYSDHSGVEQEFAQLYFGDINQIKTLETIVKQRVASKAHKIYGNDVEWINPKFNMKLQDLVKIVNDVIDQERFAVRSLREEYLPFDNLDHHKRITAKELSSSPDTYLAPNSLDKKRNKAL